MGRSRGGLTKKIHALVDADGLPVRLELSAGQAADAPMVGELLSDIKPGSTQLCRRLMTPTRSVTSLSNVSRLHDGKVMVMRSNLRRCSDGLEFTCWNREAIRLAFDRVTIA